MLLQDLGSLKSLSSARSGITRGSGRDPGSMPGTSFSCPYLELSQVSPYMSVEEKISFKKMVAITVFSRYYARRQILQSW